MSEEIVAIFPPSPLQIESSKIKIKKEIEIYLYNRTNNNILYKINTNNNNNSFTIVNPIEIIKPFSSQNIKISFINNTQNDLNNFNNNKLDVLFNFYVLNNDIPHLSNLTKIYEERIGHENQKYILNINIINKTVISKQEEETYVKDMIQKYSKLKNELKAINSHLQSIILHKNSINKNKYIALLFLILLIIISGFILGLFISKKYNKLFKKKIYEKNSNVDEDDKDFVDIKFMSVKEANEIKGVYDDNLIKFNELKNFNILNEAKKSRELIDNLNNIKKKNIDKKKNYEIFISTKVILYFIFLFLLI